MEIYDSERALVWLETEPLDLPSPVGLDWMTKEELAGYYLLFGVA